MGAAPQSWDVCIVGGGIAGCIVARDVASTGLRCVVLERDASIGGVWQNNDYAALRLHGLAAPYRAWSLAPPWQRGDRSEDNLYRPTRGEILDYVERLVDHEEIDVKTSCEYVEHAELGGGSSEMEESRRYTVTFQSMSTGESQTIRSRVIVFATGVVSTLGGQAYLPIDVAQITNGAKVLHSSQMASIDEHTLDEVENIYVVGSSKASIDLLSYFVQKNEHLVVKTKWIHRGHTIFTRRESMEGWMISPNPICQRTRCFLFHTASWMCFRQMFRPVILGMCASPDFTRTGTVLARIPYRGGIENSAVLEGVQSLFGPSQLLLKRKTESNGNVESVLVNPAGILEFHAQDGSLIQVTGNDLVIFCTGQRRDHGNNFLLFPQLNSMGVFTVHQYCQIPPVCAVLTAGLIISYLDRVIDKTETLDTIYTTGHLTKQLARIHKRLDHAKDKSSWALALTYLGGMFALVQPTLTPKIIGDLGFHHRWQRDWFGKDLDVRLDLLPLVAMPTTCC